MFVPQSTNPTDISSLLPSSSSLHFPAFSLLLFCVLLTPRRRVCPLKKAIIQHGGLQRNVTYQLFNGQFSDPCLFLSLAISKLSERWIHLCRRREDATRIDGRPPSQIFELTRLAELTDSSRERCFTFATVMHHVTKILEGQDKGQLYVR